MSDEDQLLREEVAKKDLCSYDAKKMIGHGSFGAVFLARDVDTDEMVAIKKVLQDRRFKNRELQIMKQLVKQPHPYIVVLKNSFASKGSKPDDIYLNLVLEYLPETLYSLGKYFKKRQEYMPTFSIKVYMYQLCRSLAHIHGMGICHRDIKPHNLLVDPMRHVLKLCDFGSAKAFVKGEPNVAYICSRFYRAPELIFGCTDYTTAIDVWSAGCVFAELLLGTPIFPGCSAPDQLVEIIKIMGTPNKDQLKVLKPPGADFRYPVIPARPWSTIFRNGTSPETLDIIAKMLDYLPEVRVGAINACTHSFFNELRNPATTLPDRSPLPPEMFQFTSEELALASPEALEILMQNGSVLSTASTKSAAAPAPVPPTTTTTSATNAAADGNKNNAAPTDSLAPASTAAHTEPESTETTANAAQPPVTAVPSMAVDDVPQHV